MKLDTRTDEHSIAISLRISLTILTLMRGGRRTSDKYSIYSVICYCGLLLQKSLGEKGQILGICSGCSDGRYDMWSRR